MFKVPVSQGMRRRVTGLNVVSSVVQRSSLEDRNREILQAPVPKLSPGELSVRQPSLARLPSSFLMRTTSGAGDLSFHFKTKKNNDYQQRFAFTDDYCFFFCCVPVDASLGELISSSPASRQTEDPFGAERCAKTRDEFSSSPEARPHGRSIHQVQSLVR